MSAHNHVMRKFGFEEKKMEDIKSLAGKGAWVMIFILKILIRIVSH